MEVGDGAEMTSSSFTTPKLTSYDGEGQHSDSEITRNNSFDLQTVPDFEEEHSFHTDHQNSPLHTDPPQTRILGNVDTESRDSVPLIARINSATKDIILPSKQEQGSNVSEESSATTTATAKLAANAILALTGKVHVSSPASEITGTVQNCTPEVEVAEGNVASAPTGSVTNSACEESRELSFENVFPVKNIEAINPDTGIESSEEISDPTETLLLTNAPASDLQECEGPDFAPTEIATFDEDPIPSNPDTSSLAEVQCSPFSILVAEETITEVTANIPGPDAANPSSSILVCDAYNPCTKTRKSWVDYDSDNEDSIHGVSLESRENNCNSRDASLENSSSKALPTFESDPQLVTEPFSIDIRLKSVTDVLELVMENKNSPSLKIGWDKIFMEGLYASTTTNLSGIDSLLDGVLLIPAEKSTINQPQATFEVPTTEALVSEKNRIAEKETEDREDIVDRCRLEIFTNHLSWMKTELLLLDFENDDDDNIISKTKLKTVSFVDNEDDRPSDTETESESKDKDEDKDEIEDTESPWWESKLAMPEPKDSESLLVLEAILAQIEKRNADVVARGLRKSIIKHRDRFLRLINEDVRPCNDKIREVLKKMLGTRRSVWDLFSLGSALDTEITNLSDTLEIHDSLSCAVWQRKLQLLATAFSDFEKKAEKTQESINLLERGFDFKIKNISDKITEINGTRDCVLEDYDLFCEFNSPCIIFETFNTHHCTHVEDYEKGTMWYYYLDFGEFEEFLTDDIHALVSSKKPLETFINLVREDLEQVKNLGKSLLL